MTAPTGQGDPYRPLGMPCGTCGGRGGVHQRRCPDYNPPIGPDSDRTGSGNGQETCTSCGFGERHQIHGNNPFGAGHPFRRPAPQQPPAQEREVSYGGVRTVREPSQALTDAKARARVAIDAARTPPSEADSAGEDGLRERVADVMARLNACRRNAADAGRPAVAFAYDDGAEWLRRALAASSGVRGGDGYGTEPGPSAAGQVDAHTGPIDGEARERIAAVLALHQSLGGQNVWCGHDGEHWPCATVRAAGGSR